MALRHEKLTRAILECIFEVHNEIGVGLDEETYHQGLLECFSRKGIPAISKERKYIVHRNVRIRGFELDLLLFEKIILALKSLQCDFLQAHFVQLISELKLWKKDLGLLVNFGRSKAKIERLPFNEKEKKILEDYSEIKGRIDESARKLLAKVRESILFVFETHGLGFGKVIYLDLLRAELDYWEIVYDNDARVQIEYLGKPIRSCKAKALHIADQLLCGVTAIQNQIRLFDVARMKTYLRHSDIPFGLLVNFGKSSLEIRAIGR